ncbi:MAG: V-type ATP synthase subunit E [Candidatus Hodarchaeota archaeon]
MKEQFGQLGLYLTNKAEEEIKEINQQMLFQKAEIKKSYIKRVNEISIRIKNQFVEKYNQFLNKSLSSNLLQAKESILKLKNKFLKDLNRELINQIEKNISDNYNNYLNFLITYIKNSIHLIDKPPKLILILNSRDFSKAKNRILSIKNLFKSEIELISSKDSFIGGFKAIIGDSEITYNYSIDNLLTKNLIKIENQLTKIFSEAEMENVQIEFENYIKHKKNGIEEYIKEYDQL